jgi:hypothetical protein
MTSVKNNIERFLGIEIRLYFKNGLMENMGDGLLISDGEKIHVWTGKITDDGKNFLIPAASVKEIDVKKLKKAIYRNVENGNPRTFFF